LLLYSAQVSGNCYKARLLLAHLGVDYDGARSTSSTGPVALICSVRLTPPCRYRRLCWMTAVHALYAYTHIAADGGFDLSRYPAIGRWLDPVAAQPGHVLITA
jgi:hypothetical protein